MLLVVDGAGAEGTGISFRSRGDDHQRTYGTALILSQKAEGKIKAVCQLGKHLSGGGVPGGEKGFKLT